MALNPLLPPPAHIAIAIVLLKSKPPSFTVDEYLRQIRSVISKSTSNTLREGQHLNTASFWKKAFEACEEEKSNLRNQLLDLEQRYNASLPLVSNPQAEDRPETSSGLQSTAKSDGHSKRKRVELSEDEDILECELGRGDKETSNSLLRSLYALRRLHNHNPIFLESKIYTITASCHSIIRAINSCNEKAGEAMITHSKTSFAYVCQVVILVWDAIFSALSTMEHNEIRCCLPHLVMAFQSALDQLHKLCLDEAIRREEHSMRCEKKPESNTKIGEDDTKEKSEYSRKKCEVLAMMLVKMITATDVSQVDPAILFEGITCAFLDHLGSTLSLSLFGDPGTHDHSEMGLVPPRGLLNHQGVETKIAIAAVCIEAPYLVYILRDLPKLLDSDSDNNKVRVREDSNQANQNTSPFWTISRHRLQNTLLRAVFGDDDPTFKDALTRVKMVKTDLFEKLDISMNEGRESSEWFLKQVWENLGWDVLIEV